MSNFQCVLKLPQQNAFTFTFFFPKRKSLEKIFLLNNVKDNNLKREDNVIGIKLFEI